MYGDCASELTLPNEWDHHNSSELMNDNEDLSNTSHEEATKVFEQWQTDDQDQDLTDIMEVDEQLGSNLLGDDIFHDPSVSPTGPLEELVCMSIDEEDIDRFSLSLLTDGDTPEGDGAKEKNNMNDSNISNLPFDERYRATLKKLAESMQRSQETRKSLTIKTPKTEKYPRSSSVSGVLTSIEKSSKQLQAYLNNIQRV